MVAVFFFPLISAHPIKHPCVCVSSPLRCRMLPQPRNAVEAFGIFAFGCAAIALSVRTSHAMIVANETPPTAEQIDALRRMHEQARRSSQESALSLLAAPPDTTKRRHAGDSSRRDV